MLYIAYGSNMNVRQMASRCPKAKPVGPILLKGWRLVMKRVADVEPDPQAIIPAALWKITAACEQALDLYEGFPNFYTKHRLRIDLNSGRRARPMLYRMSNPEMRAVTPSLEAYLWAVAEGYRDFGFDDLTPLLKAQHEAKKGCAEDR
jgi:hypothetical protein